MDTERTGFTDRAFFEVLEPRLLLSGAVDSVTAALDGPSVLSSVLIERGINYEVVGLNDDAYQYDIDIEGEGLLAAEVTTPWGEQVDTVTLLAGWDGQGWYEVTRGPLVVEAGFDNGTLELEIYWDWLSDDQWASLDAGQTAITISGAGGVLWDEVLDFTVVQQPL